VPIGAANPCRTKGKANRGAQSLSTSKAKLKIKVEKDAPQKLDQSDIRMKKNNGLEVVDQPREKVGGTGEPFRHQRKMRLERFDA